MVAARLKMKLKLGCGRAKTDPGFNFSTVHVGIVEGGLRSILPLRTSFTWDVRTIPGQRARDVLDAFEALKMKSFRRWCCLPGAIPPSFSRMPRV